MQFPDEGAEQRHVPVVAPIVAREVESKELLGSAGQLIIHHEQRRYILRRTKSGKLILNA
ncbi:hemin uptake protein HemP [Vreelandella profundi]|uniref:hemin uptake protein HemP n=1 Tax=Vreelandella profundi TaxID=2852117 RepID=UPI001EF06F50|nr:hemin uptake protein HemP [Halomonas profundi]